MVIDELAQFAARQVADGLPPTVSHAAKRALVDWFSALFPGTRIAPAANLMAAHRHELGVGNASLPGLKTTSFPATAAWINGSVSHAVEFDDIFRDAIYHPGCPTVAAALAVAEHLCASGSRLLEAITVGYEISTRIGVAVQPSHYKFFHTTGTVGCFGGAATATVLLSPTDEAPTHSFASSATFASGLQQAFRSDAMTKALHAGHAAWVGVTSAFGAESGVTGVLDILEGSAGFGAALADGPDWSKATEGLGSRFNIESVTVKNHGCCGHTFASIDGLLALRAQHGFGVNDIESIEISTYGAAVEVAGIREPKSPFECKFSIPYAVAHAAHHGSVRMAAFDIDRIFDVTVRNLMPRIHLRADPELTRRFPGMRAANVQVVLKSGQVLNHFQPHRIGDPEAPLTDEQVSEKFLELASPVISTDGAKKLLDQLWNIDQVRDVRSLRLQLL
jgi:2-methylcitrate dehydratase PrpD